MDVLRILGVIWTLCLLTITRAGPIVETTNGPVEGELETKMIYLQTSVDINLVLC